MNAPGYHGLNIHFPHSFVIRVRGRQEPTCVNNLVSIFVQLFLFTKASHHSSPNLLREMQKAHQSKFEIFSNDMFAILYAHSEIKKKITHLSENISRDLKELFITLGTGKTSWFQREMNSVISRYVIYKFGLLNFTLNFSSLD